MISVMYIKEIVKVFTLRKTLINKKKNYICFSWFGEGKHWEEYARVFVNKGVEAANAYIIEEVLGIPRK